MSAVYRLKESLAFKIVRLFPHWISPQMLSWLRLILAVPLILFLQQNNRIYALGLFIFAALLDYLDGPLARLTNRVTTLGKLLDPLADKLIALPTIYYLGQLFLPTILIYTIFTLELILIAMSIILKPIFRALGQARPLGANIFGKYKFATQVVLIICMFTLPPTAGIIVVTQILAGLAILLSAASIIKHLLPEQHDQN